MTKIIDIIHRDHGNSAILALGPEADQIISQHQQLLDAGEYAENPAVWLMGKSADEAAAQEAYNRIRDKALHNWLSAIPREQMVATLNTMAAMFGGCSIVPLPGESFSPSSLADLWDNANPGEEPIHPNPDLLP